MHQRKGGTDRGGSKEASEEATGLRRVVHLGLPAEMTKTKIKNTYIQIYYNNAIHIKENTKKNQKLTVQSGKNLVGSFL